MEQNERGMLLTIVQFLCNAAILCLIISENQTYFNCESTPAHRPSLALKIFVVRSHSKAGTKRKLTLFISVNLDL